MARTLPSELQPFGHVVGQVVRAVGDTDSDGDTDPDAIPITGDGLVRLVPVQMSRVATSTTPNTYVTQETISANLDDDGILSIGGHQGVALWPGIWKARPGDESIFSFPEFTFEVTSGHTAAAPLELWSAAPWTPPTGTITYTLVVPSGQLPGQTLAWDGSQLVWVTPKITPTATTLAAGSNATATMSGSWPNLTLGLGIPAGQPSTYQIVGAGRPDIPASMTTAVQAQVAAAPVGATFSSTDGASVGAWQWQKLPAGWTVDVGDTGISQMSPSSALNGWTFQEVAFTRSGNWVQCEVYKLNPAAATNDIFINVPAGYRPFVTFSSFPIIRLGTTGYGASTTACITCDGNTLRILGRSTIGTNVVGSDLKLIFSWWTTNSWPTVLPS